MPYENIEGTTQKMALANQGAQNVHMMFQSLLDRRQRRGEVRGQMITQLMQPGMEGAQERETEKLRQKGASELEGQKERLFQSRYLNKDYLAATNEPRKGMLADTEMIDYFMTHPDAYAVWKEMAKTKQQTSHYSSSPEQEAAARAALAVSPEAYVADKLENFKASIALADGTPDPNRDNATGFRAYLDTMIPLDEQGGMFDRRMSGYRAIMDNLDSLVAAHYAPGSNPAGPGGRGGTVDEVSYTELSKGKDLLDELLRSLPEQATEERTRISSALNQIENALASPQAETRNDLRNALNVIQEQLKGAGAAAKRARDRAKAEEMGVPLEVYDIMGKPIQAMPWKKP